MPKISVIRGIVPGGRIRNFRAIKTRGVIKLITLAEKNPAALKKIIIFLSKLDSLNVKLASTIPKIYSRDTGESARYELISLTGTINYLKNFDKKPVSKK